MAVCGVCKNPSSEASDVKCTGTCGFVFHYECIKSELDKKTRRQPKEYKCKDCTTTSSQGSAKSSSSTTNVLSKEFLVSVMEGFKQEVFTEMESFKTEVFSEIVAFRSDINSLSASLQFMSDKMDSTNKLMEQLNSQFKQLKKENEEMKSNYVAVKGEVRDLRERLRNLEQYTRVNNIEVNGLPVTREECVSDLVRDLGAAIGVEVQANDVSTAHRVPSYSRDRDQALIIQFTSRARREEWISKYRAKKPALTAQQVNQRFPSQRVYINDHLSPENKQLLSRMKKRCREVGYTFAWCRDAKFFARKSEGDPVQRIFSFEDIETKIK